MGSQLPVFYAAVLCDASLTFSIIILDYDSSTRNRVCGGLLLAVISMKSGSGHPTRSLPIAAMESYSESPFLLG
jgi:hypothetical protein